MGPTTADETALRAAFREARSGFFHVGIFSFFLNLLMLVSPIYMMQVFDRVLASGRVETLILLTVIAGFAVLVLGILDTVRKRVLTRISTWLDHRLSAQLIASSVTGQLRGLSLGSEPLRDLGSIRNFVNGQGIFPLFDAPWVPIFVLVIWAMHPYLGALALVSAIILFGIAVANEFVSRGPLKRASQVQVNAFNQADSAIRNADVVQAMGMLPPLLKRWDNQNEKALSEQQVAADRAGSLGGASKFIRMFVQIGILGIGAYLGLQGELTGGGMIAASVLLGRALAP
ncbi:MAG: ABC transporter transmembrane domain-containing protein, partial [Pseudomonadota bacterium]